MRRLIIEKLLVYVLAFVLCFIAFQKIGKQIDQIEKDFVDKMDTTMEKFGYKKGSSLLDDLVYEQDANKVTIKYNVGKKKVKIKDVTAILNLKTDTDLTEVYPLLSSLYDEDVNAYANEIETLKSDYFKTGEKQMFQDLNSKRQLTIYIEDSQDADFDYEFHYSIMDLSR